MQLYQFGGFVANETCAEDSDNRRARREMARKCNVVSDAFNRKLHVKAYFSAAAPESPD
ncbi:MAG: hypothetical protein IJJ99_09735 [Oscillospiraceae bacterium]|nr:hypothetical protein [Oscillospiraceae bacterium]